VRVVKSFWQYNNLKHEFTFQAILNSSQVAPEFFLKRMMLLCFCNFSVGMCTPYSNAAA
jgi:hypothetical protein